MVVVEESMLMGSVAGVSGVSVDACRFLDVLLLGDFLEHAEFRSWGFSGVRGFVGVG